MITAQTLGLSLKAGQNITLSSTSWQEFQDILLALPQRRTARLAYADKILEIMVPLPEHERSKIILADLVKTLLRLQRRPWEPLCSTTFKLETMEVGIEPDECFYIQNYRSVIGKERLDLTLDPPPDLAIEIDIISKTQQAAYLALKVPELWIYERGKLNMYLWQSGQYILSKNSLNFPDIPITELIPQFMERAKVVGVSQMLLEFEEYIKALMDS